MSSEAQSIYRTTNTGDSLGIPPVLATPLRELEMLLRTSPPCRLIVYVHPRLYDVVKKINGRIGKPLTYMGAWINEDPSASHLGALFVERLRGAPVIEKGQP
jgi:hypothetical protein